MVETLTLPPLRQELGLFPAPTSADGTPAWTLHDPPSNRFFLLGWPAFEILSRWHIGTVQTVVETVNRETTLTLTDEDVLGVIAFLEQNFLLEAVSRRSWERLVASHAAHRLDWGTWLLKNYLFFRVPLIRPQRFLDRAAPWVDWLYSRSFLIFISLAALAAAFFISRQWDVFRHSFSAYQSWVGIATVGCAVALAKVAHEFGHAFTAHRYGCRVPTMGVALVVLTPMLYTDTNEAWKLTSRRHRIAIGIAGIAAELLLALAAIWVWFLLPEGPVRGATFILATTTWVMTVALNATPFMRFDGYFLLSDLLGVPNLNERSSAFGSWWMRERLFGLGDSPPEPASPPRRHFMVIFSYAAWLYRFFLFLGIALLVYFYFFKALGVFLFAVEIGWFILLPIYREGQGWWRLRERIRLNRTTARSILLILSAVILLVIPWHGRLAVPAVLSAAREQQITAPLPSVVLEEPAAASRMVRAGEVLIRLASPDLEQRIRQGRTSTSLSRWQVTQQAFDRSLLKQGKVLQRRFEAGTTELAGLLEEQERLIVRAPFDGAIVARNEELTPGLWLSRKEPLYIIADMARNRVDAYADERDMSRITVGAPARFIPDAPEFGALECWVAEIDRVNVPVIDEPSLASVYGGPIAARHDPHGLPLPNSPVFRIRLDRCSPAGVPAMKLRGIAHIDGERRSLLADAFRYASALIVRESGL